MLIIINIIYYFIIITYNAFNVYIYFYIIFMKCQLEDISLLNILYNSSINKVYVMLC